MDSYAQELLATIESLTESKNKLQTYMLEQVRLPLTNKLQSYMLEQVRLPDQDSYDLGTEVHH